MKRNLLILFAPILLMICVNESVRFFSGISGSRIKGVNVINTIHQSKDKCSWACHNQTNFCKQHHVKMDKAYFQYTDLLYFGLINLLANTGNYGLANIVFLVLIGPLLIYFLLIKCIGLQEKINAL